MNFEENSKNNQNYLGNIKSDKELDEMLAQAPGQLNFTIFLAMMGDKIKGEKLERKRLVSRA